MDSEMLRIAIALLPFAVLIAGFLVFRMDALKLSVYTALLEVAIVMGLYRLSPGQVLAAIIWGNITVWSGFAVLYTGQIFGHSFRQTGLLRVLLDTVEGVLPSKEGKAVTLVNVVGGFMGAFNGFATYPITIPGLVEEGFYPVRAVAGYLVYFSWSVAFVSLFIAATIASAASGVPIEDIARVMGLMTIPLVPIATLGFFRIMEFSLKERENQILFGLTTLANVAAIVLFTQVFNGLYILTLIAAAVFSLGLLYAYRRLAIRDLDAALDDGRAHPRATMLKAYAPLLVGVVLVVLTKVPAVAALLDRLQFTVAAWGYAPLTVNVFTSAGFFILVAALSCYVFAVKRGSNPLLDLQVATRKGAPSLATLFAGSAMVYLMIDTGQISLLGQVLSQWGAMVYALLLPGVGFLAGMAFGQGIPADFLFSRMQVKVAPMLGIPLVVLVALAAQVTMGPANPLKPSLIKFTSTLAGLKGHDGAIFRIVLPWQLVQLAIIVASALLLVAFWK